MPDRVVASLEDALLRESDVALLDGPFWLNDRLIAFYFEHLHQSKFDGSEKVCFLSPEVSQFLKLASKEEIPVFIQPLNLEGKDIIIMAVNNASDPSQPGGSHWSLLIYSSQLRHFYHLDSSPGTNEEHARHMARKIHDFLVKRERPDSGVSAFFDFRLSAVEVLKQTNGYDCGIHVLHNAEHATRHFFLYGGPSGLEPTNPGDIKEMRTKMKSEIGRHSNR